MQILVFGMHRSGTSMVSRLLNMMGIYFAPEGVSNGANEENPKGFWERRDVRALNDMVLRSTGADWDRLSAFSLDKVPPANLTQFRQEASRIILAMDAHRPWFLKEPRLCVLAPLWLELLEFPVCVFVHRLPLEVARSLQMRNAFRPDFSLALWERYMVAALNSTRDLRRIQVNHADLIADPVAVVRDLAVKLGKSGVVGLRAPSDAEIVAFIELSLYRAKVSAKGGVVRLSVAQRKLRKAFESEAALHASKPFRLSSSAQVILAEHDESVAAQEKIVQLEKQNAALALEMSALKDASTQTRAQLEEARSEMVRLKKESAERLRLLKEARESAQVGRQVREVLKRTATAAEVLRRDSEIAKLRQVLSERGARIERDKADSATLRAEVATLRRDLQKRQQELETEKMSSKTDASRVTALNQAVARRETLLASERAVIEELTARNRILQKGLDKVEDYFKKLQASRSFRFMVYKARRLGLVSRTPRRLVESIKEQFPATRKALKNINAAPKPPAVAPGGGGKSAPPSQPQRSDPVKGETPNRNDPKAKAQIAHTTASRFAASAKNALALPAPGPTGDASVCFIILHHSGEHQLKNLFTSFLKVNTYPSVEFSILLHACVDRSREVIRSFQDRLCIRVTESAQKISFAKSNNRAAESTRTDYLVFLNNGIIFEEDVVGELLRCLRDPRTGLAGVRLLYPSEDLDYPGGLQHAGIKFRLDPFFFFHRPVHLGVPEKIADTPRVLEKFPAITGALAGCRRRDFLRAGGFCEEYEDGFEDVDLALSFERLLGLRAVSANHVACRHKESATGRLDQTESAAEPRRLSSLGHLARRHGWHLRRKMFADKMASRLFFSDEQLEVAFAVTEASSNTTAGDFFSALELADACRKEFGWNVRYLSRKKDWYDLSGVDILVVLLDKYELSQIRNAKPDLLKIAWMRNWFDRWASRSDFDGYDLFLCSSACSAQWIGEHHQKPAWVFPLATNRDRFTAGKPDSRFRSDYCFTGSYWQFDREIETALHPEKLEPYKFALFGSGWETHPTLRAYTRGFVPYAELPNVYASTRIVVDDANHVTKRWGSMNSRVFDALASGALVITNGEAGAGEIFAGELPVYGSPEELEALLRRYLENDDERREIVDRLRQKVLSLHTYRHRARTLKRILLTRARRSYRVALKVAVPDRRQSRHWGDYHFALSLGRALAARGHSFRIDCLDEWERPEASGDDVVIVLRGLTQYRPKEGQINLIWNISHPDKIRDEEYEEFDQVFVASRLQAEYLAARLQPPVCALLQCTDPAIFYPDPNPDLPAETLLFVGNSRKQNREAVRFAVQANLPLGVYGLDWSPLVPADYIRGEHIENAILRQHYSQCDILLNDHWPAMRERGFISNRLFDAAAAGVFVITDPVEDVSAVFGHDAVVYRSEAEFRDLVEHYLAHPEERRERADRIRMRVLAEHTFAHRAEVILGKIKELDERKRSPRGLTIKSLSDATQPEVDPGRIQSPTDLRTRRSSGDGTSSPGTLRQPNGRSRVAQRLANQALPGQRPALPAESTCLAISIKTSVPNLEEAPAWGDHHFALALQRSIQSLGHVCRIDMNPDWHQEGAQDDDITLTLRGRHRYRPNQRQVNLMWNISHPDRVAPGEYEDFDHVFIASHFYAEALSATLGARVSALLQCTDPEVFFSDHSDGLGVDPLLFVGNSRKEYRRIVKDAIAVGLPVAVYGSLWDNFLPPGHLKGTHIENTVLRRYYSGCKILLNDHWKTMAQNGFLSNRLFDAGACAACIISDRAAGMEAVFSQTVLTYETPEELRELVDYYLSHDEERRRKGQELREIICGAHTFDLRAQQIINIATGLLEERARGKSTLGARGDGKAKALIERAPEKVELNRDGQWSSKRIKFFLSQSERIWSNELAEAEFKGWCFFKDGGQAQGIRFRYGRACYEGKCGLERPDVAKVFPNNPVALRSGFEITAPLPFLRQVAYLELKDINGVWVPFHARWVSAWRFHLKPVLALRQWLTQFEVRQRVLRLARRPSLFHQIIRRELSLTLDLDFWSAMESSEAAVRAEAPSRSTGESLPLVSIIMPTYNRAALILHAIESVRAQSWGNWELHVCDDGSEDATESVIASLRESRIKFHKLPHVGAASARNHGLACATGRYVAYLDTDNVWHPDYLLIMVRALENQPNAFTAYCKYLDTELDQKGRYRLAAYRDLPFDYDRLAAKNFIDLNGFCHRLEVYRELGGFTDQLIRLQDWDLAVRYTFYRDPLYVDKFLVIYRRHAGWKQLTTLHEYRIAPRQIVRQNIEHLFLGAPDLSRHLGDPARVHAVVHGQLVSAPGFGTFVRALARYCQVEVMIFGSADGAHCESIFSRAQLSFQTEDSTEAPIDVFSAASVLLVLGCDDFALYVAHRIHNEFKVPIIVDDAHGFPVGGGTSPKCNELAEISPHHLVHADSEAPIEAIQLAGIWDERVFRADHANPAVGADLSLLLDDYGLSPSEVGEIRDRMESLPGRPLRVILLSSVFSKKDALNGSTPDQRPLSFRADAYLLWRSESSQDLTPTLGLPFALALEIPILSNQDLSQIDARPANFSRTVDWGKFEEVKAEMLALEGNPGRAAGMTAYGRRVFMRKFAASTVGRAVAIYCRIIAQTREKLELTTSLAAPSRAAAMAVANAELDRSLQPATN